MKKSQKPERDAPLKGLDGLLLDLLVRWWHGSGSLCESKGDEPHKRDSQQSLPAFPAGSAFDAGDGCRGLVVVARAWPAAS